MVCEYWDMPRCLLCFYLELHNVDVEFAAFHSTKPQYKVVVVYFRLPRHVGTPKFEIIPNIIYSELIIIIIKQSLILITQTKGYVV